MKTKLRACPSDTETINGCGTVSGAVPMAIRWTFALPTRRFHSVTLIRKERRTLRLGSTGTNGNGATVHVLNVRRPRSGSKAPSVAVPPLPRPITINRSELLTRAVQIYHETLQEDRKGIGLPGGTEGSKTGNFLKRFKIGYVNGRLRRHFARGSRPRIYSWIERSGDFKRERPGTLSMGAWCSRSSTITARWWGCMAEESVGPGLWAGPSLFAWTPARGVERCEWLKAYKEDHSGGKHY
jgi:hypothetical protein